MVQLFGALQPWSFRLFLKSRKCYLVQCKKCNSQKLDKAEAAFRLARLRAQGILARNSDPFGHLRDFEHLWIEADYCRELQEYGNLDDEVYVARVCRQSEQEIREWLTERLKKLAAV